MWANGEMASGELLGGQAARFALPYSLFATPIRIFSRDCPFAMSHGI
jgi:hypothetical protein